MRYYQTNKDILRKGILKLLEVKDSDIRLKNIFQCKFAVDQAIHAGGASSATLPLVTLYYGGFLDIDIENPNRVSQDMFVLSKGHAIAALASIYADLGYFDKSILKNSRSVDSILNGHPGPVLPGIQIATGPMGQGLGVAQGYALAGQSNPHFDVFTMTGDGELQEGPIWEAVMFAGYKRLDNLCVLVDSNEGQLDVVNRLILPHKSIEKSFGSFGWRVLSADATKYDSVFHCLEVFKNEPRDGRPTVIVCHAFKGSGSLSRFLNRHKVVVPDDILEQEARLQEERRQKRVLDFVDFYDSLDGNSQDRLKKVSRKMNLELAAGPGSAKDLRPCKPEVRTKPSPPREKQIRYDKDKLPVLDKSKTYSAHQLIAEAMKVFAQDSRVMSVDSDLASTSGLEAGVSSVDQNRAFNVGVAEANMMLIGEAYASLGYNAWVSTFCPFFDWKILRRIAVGHQERLEVMAVENGWLTEGYGLDLTFLATAADFDTQTNGATHMGNDDALLFDALAHLKIISLSCPQQLLEALTTAGLLEKDGIRARVIDMPSVDAASMENLLDNNIPVFIIEQNNGYLWSKLLREISLKGRTIENDKIIPINAMNANGAINFIHSGKYEQLISHLGLAPAQLANRIRNKLKLAEV
jgi:transketolase